jgi:hypothetical protein
MVTCFAPTLQICYVFLLLKTVFVIFFGCSILEPWAIFFWKLCHPEDLTDVIYLTDVLIVFGCWCLGAFPDGPGDGETIPGRQTLASTIPCATR